MSVRVNLIASSALFLSPVAYGDVSLISQSRHYSVNPASGMSNVTTTVSGEVDWNVGGSDDFGSSLLNVQSYIGTGQIRSIASISVGAGPQMGHASGTYTFDSTFIVTSYSAYDLSIDLRGYGFFEDPTGSSGCIAHVKLTKNSGTPATLFDNSNSSTFPYMPHLTGFLFPGTYTLHSDLGASASHARSASGHANVILTVPVPTPAAAFLVAALLAARRRR